MSTIFHKKGPTIIAFSGGCYSGKTTSMQRLQRHIGLDRCIFLSELIREKLTTSIDDIRAHPSDYLRLQCDIIKQKINQEMELPLYNKDLVILVDRAIADSIFYMLFYIDKHSLTEPELRTYYGLYKYARDYAKFAYKNIYSAVLFFEPIEEKCIDLVNRPKAINSTMKFFERDLIKSINEEYTDYLYSIDLNKYPGTFTEAESMDKLLKETVGLKLK